MKLSILTTFATLLFCVAVQAEVVTGIYKTEATEDGAFLQVEFGPCDKDPSLSCGIILKAYESESKINSNYSHLGKIIVENMKTEGSGKFSGGTIWDPSEDKIYKSKMTSVGTDLSVEGCILFFCRAQLWKRVN